MEDRLRILGWPLSRVFVLQVDFIHHKLSMPLTLSMSFLLGDAWVPDSQLQRYDKRTSYLPAASPLPRHEA